MTCTLYFARFRGMERAAVQLSEKDGFVRFEVHAKPRAKKSKVVGPRETRTGTALEVAIAAPPVDGAANEEIRAFFAKLLGVPRGDVEIVTGASSRSKIVEVRGTTVASVREKLGLK